MLCSSQLRQHALTSGCRGLRPTEGDSQPPMAQRLFCFLRSRARVDGWHHRLGKRGLLSHNSCRRGSRQQWRGVLQTPNVWHRRGGRLPLHIGMRPANLQSINQDPRGETPLSGRLQEALIWRAIIECQVCLVARQTRQGKQAPLLCWMELCWCTLQTQPQDIQDQVCPATHQGKTTDNQRAKWHCKDELAANFCQQLPVSAAGKQTGLQVADRGSSHCSQHVPPTLQCMLIFQGLQRQPAQ